MDSELTNQGEKTQADFEIKEPNGGMTIKIDPSNKRLLNAAKKILDKKNTAVSIKRQEVEDSEQINESDLQNILSKEDYVFYQSKKQLYMQAYPDLTDPFDLDVLHSIIMEQIFQRGLLRQKKKFPTKDITDAYEKSTKRLATMRADLSVRRTDRVKDKANKKSTVNIASLSVLFNSPEKIQGLEDRVLDLKNQESIFDDPDKVVE